MITLGVDNSLSGALCILSGQSIVAMTTMPVKEYVPPKKGAKTTREIDIVTVWHWLNERVGHQLDQVVVMIEKPTNAKTYRAAEAMAGSFHALRAMCELKHLQWQRITPQSWQKVMLPGCVKGDTKPAALRAAKAIWPNENWLATSRSKVPHDGLVDAALIAEYCRRTIK
jgi:hypothetical protein